MSIASWLRTLFQKRAPSTPSPTNTAPDEPPRADAVPEPVPDETPAFIDNGVRMHIAAHDPEFPAKREAAVNTILAAIDAVAQAHGFTKKAKSWAKSGDLGTVSIHLQRSRYGFDCHINLGFQPKSEESHGPWSQDDFVPLGRFFPADTTTTGEPGTLAYLDVIEDDTILSHHIQVLNDQALPWLLAHLTEAEAHSQPFLPGPTPVE